MLQYSQSNPLENKAIIIDPGHGGEDPGKTQRDYLKVRLY